MSPAQWIFRVAGVYGLVVTVPLIFGERVMGVRQPEFYYGFVLLNLCWQIVYLTVSTRPVQHRPIMLPAMLAKASAATAILLLTLQGRISGAWVAAAAVDAVFAILFLVAFMTTRQLVTEQPAGGGSHG